MQRVTVSQRHWLTAEQFAAGYGLGQLTPGPGMLMVMAIGYKVAGALGALVSLAAMFVPVGAVAFIAGRHWDSLRASPWRTAVQQEADFQGPIGGTVDPPLSERGLMQAELLGRWLSIRPIAAIYASNLRRAQQTAAAVAKHQQKEVTIVDDLREVEVFRDIPQD